MTQGQQQQFECIGNSLFIHLRHGVHYLYLSSAHCLLPLWPCQLSQVCCMLKNKYGKLPSIITFTMFVVHKWHNPLRGVQECSEHIWDGLFSWHLCARVETDWKKRFIFLPLHLLLILLCSICCVEGSVKANLSEGGELASGAVMVGPPGSLHFLAQLSPYAGNMAGSGRFVLVRCTDGICAALRHWWRLRWCSVISAEGSSTSSPRQPERGRGCGTCHMNEELVAQHTYVTFTFGANSQLINKLLWDWQIKNMYFFILALTY